MDFLQNLLDNSNIPVITAFLLGLLTAISPCPLATNITAIGFISKDIGNRNKIFLGGLLYTLGRVVAYTVLGIILISILKEGSSMFSLQKGISKYGEILIAPVLIFVGVFMLFGDRLNLPKFGFSGTGKTERQFRQPFAWSAFRSGILPYQRTVLLRDAYTDVGSRTGRLPFAYCLCGSHRPARYSGSLDFGV